MSLLQIALGVKPNPPSRPPETTAINGLVDFLQICFPRHRQMYLVLFLQNWHATVKSVFHSTQLQAPSRSVLVKHTLSFQWLCGPPPSDSPASLIASLLSREFSVFPVFYPIHRGFRRWPCSRSVCPSMTISLAQIPRSGMES